MVLGKLSKVGSEQLKLAEQMETSLAAKVAKVGDAANQKLLKLLGEGSIKRCVVKSVLSAETKYEVSAGGFQGSFDMLRLALRRSPIQARTPVSLHPRPS